MVIDRNKRSKKLCEVKGLKNIDKKNQIQLEKEVPTSCKPLAND